MLLINATMPTYATAQEKLIAEISTQTIHLQSASKPVVAKKLPIQIDVNSHVSRSHVSRSHVLNASYPISRF